jgi:hypothetical protein
MSFHIQAPFRDTPESNNRFIDDHTTRSSKELVVGIQCVSEIDIVSPDIGAWMWKVITWVAARQAKREAPMEVEGTNGGGRHHWRLWKWLLEAVFNSECFGENQSKIGWSRAEQSTKTSEDVVLFFTVNMLPPFGRFLSSYRLPKFCLILTKILRINAVVVISPNLSIFRRNRNISWYFTNMLFLSW